MENRNFYMVNILNCNHPSSSHSLIEHELLSEMLKEKMKQLFQQIIMIYGIDLMEDQ
jgi:hypothetical protein